MSDPANAHEANAAHLVPSAPPEQRSWLTTDEWAAVIALTIAGLVKLGWLPGLQW
jgi:hypothetical protein